MNSNSLSFKTSISFEARHKWSCQGEESNFIKRDCKSYVSFENKIHKMTSNKTFKLAISWGKQCPYYNSVTPYSSSFFKSNLPKSINLKLIQYFNSLKSYKTRFPYVLPFTYELKARKFVNRSVSCVFPFNTTGTLNQELQISTQDWFW